MQRLKINKDCSLNAARLSIPPQLFINYADNGRLDGMGFAPFGEVEGDGMAIVRKIYNCGERPQQGAIQSQGNTYLDAKFPELSKIVSATIIPDAEEL